MTPLIQAEMISTVFGAHPTKALQQLQAGYDKERLLIESRHVVALHNVSLQIMPGEIFVIMGLSGSGKSTLIRHFNRLVDPTVGQIIIDGINITQIPITELIELRRTRMAMVFQHFGLHEHRKVIENVAYGLQLRKIPLKQRHEQAMAWIENVGLGGFEFHYPGQLSGGMQQRVGLARALCANTDIILMDEAFSALDPLIRAQLQDMLLSLQMQLGKTIVFITHDLDEALRIGQRIAFLKDGELIQVGTPEEILLEPASEHIREFVQGVNRARALRVMHTLEPEPPTGMPAISPETTDDAINAHASLEALLPKLAGRSAPLGIEHQGRIIGTVSIAKLQHLLNAPL